MRLWSLHPQYLDRQGLLAVWREGLLALHVLRGQTTGYTRHPQLERFKETPEPLLTIQAYLSHIVLEAESRSYAFNRTKIEFQPLEKMLSVTHGQLEFEKDHLLRKLAARDPQRHQQHLELPLPQWQPHPLFTVTPGQLASWERGAV